jgi:hypothetical protein
MGHNQLVNWCRRIEAQTLPTTGQLQAGDHFAYQGKVLRLNLDGSIPEDNPELDGVRSHIFSYGHRNPQGFAFENYVAPIATLFTVSEPPAGCEDFGYFCRPSVGPSSIAWYEGAVPELQGRLLTTAMKHGSFYAFDPAAGAGFTRYYLGQNRLRDIEIADGGRTLYLVTDSQGGVQNEEGDGAEGLENLGAILVYTAGEGKPAGNAAPGGTDGSGTTSTEAGNDAAAESDNAGGQPASDPQAAAQEAERDEADSSLQTAPEGEN